MVSAAVVLCACSEADELVADPDLVFAVERIVVEGGCRAPIVDKSCWDLLEGDASMLASIDLGPCDDLDTMADAGVGPRPRHEPGQSRFVVSARFGDVTFDEFPELEVQPLVDGSPSGPPHALEAVDDHHLVAMATVPAVTGGTLRLELDGEHGPFPRSKSVELAAPTIRAAILEDTDPLVAGIGTAMLCIEAPGDFPETASWEAAVVGTPLTTGSVAMTSKANGRRFGTAPVAIPAAPDGTFTIRARVAGLEAVVDRALTTPAPLSLTVQREDEAADSPVRMTAGEPSAECRTFDATVGAGDLPIGSNVSLQASAGRFLGGTETIAIALSASHNAAASIVLPLSPPDDLVTIVATATHVPPASVAIEILDLAGKSGFLHEPLGGSIPVDAEGSATRVLQGRLEPADGAVFPEGTVVTLAIDPETSIDDATPLMCADPVSVGELGCDPFTGLGGGCALMPPVVSVSPSGWFSVPIAGGLCFAGTLTVVAIADLYLDPSATGCLAERAIDHGAVIGSVAVVFKPT